MNGWMNERRMNEIWDLAALAHRASLQGTKVKLRLSAGPRQQHRQPYRGPRTCRGIIKHGMGMTQNHTEARESTRMQRGHVLQQACSQETNAESIASVSIPVNTS